MKLRGVSQDLDKFAAGAGAVLCVGVLAAGVVALLSPTSPEDKTYYFFLGSIGLISCVVWLRVRRNSSLKELDPSDNHTLFMLGNALFFFFLGGAVLSLHLRPEANVRPLAYFIFVALVAGAIALEVMACERTGRHVALILTQIMTVGLMSQVSELVVFPSVVGPDSSAVEQFTLQILRWGHIPTPQQYNNLVTYAYGAMPTFYLNVAATSLLTSLDYKWASMLSVGVPLVVVGAVFVFLLGKSVISPKAGLLGALTLVMANEFIYFGFASVPNTLGAIFLLVAVYMLFTTWGQNRASNLVVIVIVTGTLILTHTISAAALAIILLSGVIAASLYRKLYDRGPPTALSLTLAAAFVAAMLGWWIYASGSITDVIGLLNSQLSSSAVQPVFHLKQPLWELALRAAGISAFLALALIGCFYMISKKFGSPRGFVLVAIGVILVILGFSSAFGANSVPQRWLFFAQILYAVPLGVTLLVLAKYVHGARAKPLFLSSTVVLLSLVMVLSPTANVDNHLFGNPPWERISFTSPELSAMNTTVQKSTNDIISDTPYIHASRDHLYNLSEQIEPYSTPGALLLISSAAGSDYPFDAFYHGGVIPINDTFAPPQGNVTSLGSRVYDNGVVAGYDNSYLANRLDYWLKHP